MKRKEEYFKGCLLGGAIGDALGWPVEFLEYKYIVKRFGDGGIKDLVLNDLGEAEITDDTQMTLFTAEGILRSQARGQEKGICHPPSIVHNAYLRWLHTQGSQILGDKSIYDGWLLGVKKLHNKRGPGNTCLSALLSGEVGSTDNPINNSKGCGGVMRVAPAGLFYPKEKSFNMAMEFAAITHSHPSGYLSAGVLAYIISSIIEGVDIETAVNNSLEELKKYESHEECCYALSKAIELCKSNIDPTDAITTLGEGWVGEEALAIGVYSSLKYKDDFKKGVITAVNHSGDSDSTGAITGNILGAYLGIDNIPQEWINKVELRDEIIEISNDLLIGYSNSDDWWSKYPGY